MGTDPEIGVFTGERERREGEKRLDRSDGWASRPYLGKEGLIGWIAAVGGASFTMTGERRVVGSLGRLGQPSLPWGDTERTLGG